MSAVVEDESPAVVEWDLLGLPGGTLVEALGLCAGGVHSSLKLRMAGPFSADAMTDRPIFRRRYERQGRRGRSGVQKPLTSEGFS